jgi:hypothetical protein
MNAHIVSHPLTLPSPPVGERVAEGRVRGWFWVSRCELLQGILCLTLLSSPWALRAATVIDTDICVYGRTSGGIAAIQATRMGRTVSLAVFNTHLGGLTTGVYRWT